MMFCHPITGKSGKMFLFPRSSVTNKNFPSDDNHESYNTRPS